MPTISLKCIRVGVAACGGLLCGILPVEADNQHDYPEEGTVISATIEHGYVYTIETNDKIFQVLCVSWNPFRQTPPVCKAGGQPIAANDRVHFRLDGDMAYMRGSGSGEERLVILSTELKLLLPLPITAALAPESGAVLGLGLETRTSRHPATAAPPPTGPSASPGASSPSIPTGPVIAVPVTGGPPVQVIPTGPVNGGVVTGVPVTGGPPVTAIPAAPVGGSSAARTSGAGVANVPMTPAPTVEGSQWVHFVRVQTAGHVYDLACRSKSCSLEHNPIQLGDLLTIRIVKKSAYLSGANTGANDEQRFEILDVRSVNEEPGVPPH
jgi:hypothetical protein